MARRDRSARGLAGLALVLAASACGGEPPPGPGPDAEFDADADADVRADSGPDADDDVRADAEADAELDADTPPEADVDVFFDAEVDGEVDVDVDVEFPLDCPFEVGPGDVERVECLGLTFDVSVPGACPDDGCGLILDLHGLSMSGAMEEANTHLALQGRERGFVVIQPTASGVPPATSWYESDDDEVFDFMMAAASVLDVDERRLHVTGFSQGGFMTWRLVCDHADVLASAAPAAAGLDCLGVLIDSCAFSGEEGPARELPLLFLAGRLDTYVTADCTERQRDAVIDGFEMTLDEVVAEDEDFTHTRYLNPRGVVFETFEHDYLSTYWAPGFLPLGGHCFPGSDDPGGLPGQVMPFGCDPPNAFVWGEEVLDFFEAHPRE